MARKSPRLSNLFARTEGDLDAGNIKPIGVGLPQGEISAIESIAVELGLNRNRVLRFAVRWFVLNYQAGKIDVTQFISQPPPPPKEITYPSKLPE